MAGLQDGIDWYLKHQVEARAYRVTKVRLPKYGYTMLKDSLHCFQEERHVHICCEKLLPANCEEARVKDPWIGVDFLLIQSDMTFELLCDNIVLLRKFDQKDLKITIDLTYGVEKYHAVDVAKGIRMIRSLARFLGRVKVVFTTVQYDPCNRDIHDFYVLYNLIIFGENFKSNVYTPFLHKSTMRCKNKLMTLRNNLWVLADGGASFHFNDHAFVLYLKYVKTYHLKGFAMPTDGDCNPVTRVKRMIGCRRERAVWLDLVPLKLRFLNLMAEKGKLKRKVGESE